MVYDQDGKLLDAAPYPAVYEVAEQESYAMDNPERMRAIHQQARETMELVRQETDKRMNANRPDAQFKSGDFVYLDCSHYRLPIFTVAKSKKLRAQWFGPFKVVATHSPVAVELDLPAYLDTVHPVILSR